MKSILTLALVVLCTFIIVGCAPEQAPTETATDTTEIKADVKAEVNAEPRENKPNVKMEGPGAVALVEVTAEGNEFEPPVKKVQVPVDAWYCDMGTVHYARAEEGDGKCAKCGMALVHKEAAPAAADETTAAGHEG